MLATLTSSVRDYYDVCRRHRLCPSHADVFLALVNVCHGRKLVETSYAALADASGVSIYTARRAVDRLLAKRLIEIDRSRTRPDRLVVIVIRQEEAIGDEKDELATVRFPGPEGLESDEPAETMTLDSPQPLAEAHALAQAHAQAEAPSASVSTQTPDYADTCEQSTTINRDLACGSLPILNEKKRNTSNTQGDLCKDLDIERPPDSHSKRPHCEPPRAGKPPTASPRRRGPPPIEARADPPLIGNALQDMFNGMFTRGSSAARDERMDLAERLERSVADPTCDSSLYRRVAEAVVDGRLDREDLNGILAYVSKHRVAGTIRTSPGALFNYLIRKRLGADYKGGST